jgi:hypothetical protein
VAIVFRTCSISHYTAADSATAGDVSEVLGHTSITVTKDVYGHLLEGSRRSAAEAMTRVLFDNPEDSTGSPRGSQVRSEDDRK